MTNKKNVKKLIPPRPDDMDPVFGWPRADSAESRRLVHEVARIIEQARLEGGVNRSHYDKIIRDRNRSPR